MNILIAYISLLNENAPEREYTTVAPLVPCTINGRQTNEAAAKYLLYALNSKDECLDKIIYIATKEVMNNTIVIDDCSYKTDEYFKKKVEKYCRENAITVPEFIQIPVADKLTPQILDRITKHIQKGDNIYLDTTGGRRDAVNSIQLLTKFLTYSSINTKQAFYTNINPPEITSADDVYELLTLLDGIAQFTSTARSDLLKQALANERTKEIEALLSVMESFTSKLQLCQTEEIDEILSQMESRLNAVSQIETTTSKLLLFKQLVPIIHEKFFGNGNSQSSCISLIRWCVSNSLLQQALTIYVERVPKYLLDNNIIELMLEDKIEGARGLDESANMLYSGFLDSCDESRSCLFSIKKYLGDLKALYPKDYVNIFLNSDKPFTKKLIKIFKAYEREFNGKEYTRENILYVEKYSSSNTSKLLASFALHRENKKVSQIDKSVKRTIGGSFNNEPLICKLLDVTPKPENVIDKKILTINSLDYWYGKRIKSNISKDVLKRVLLDYVYIKAIRNQINHASKDENIQGETKNIYIQNGYKAIVQMNVENLAADINTALNVIEGGK